jgi:hypothetical protein
MDGIATYLEMVLCAGSIVGGCRWCGILHLNMWGVERLQTCREELLHYSRDYTRRTKGFQRV